MTRMTRAGMLLLLLMTFVSAVGAQSGPGYAFERLLEVDWTFKLSENPLFATELGDHTNDGVLPQEGLADERRRWVHDRQMLTRLAKIDPAELTPADRINYAIFKRLKQDAVDEYRFGRHLMPITNRTGFHVEFPKLPERMLLYTTLDYESYITRLSQFDRYAGQFIERMREGIAQGLVLPEIVLEGYEDSIEAHIVDDPTQSLLWEPLVEFPDQISEEDRDALRGAAGKAIMDSVVPGYRAFAAFMAQEYLPAARETIGASKLPEGKAFYEHRVRRFTTTEMTPQEVHDLGLAEVARLREEMLLVIERSGFEGDFAAFVDYLRTDDQFYARSPDELIREVSTVMKRMDGALPRLFRTLPRMPYGVRPVPAYIAPKTTTAYYEAPAGDGSRAGFYFVNTHDLRARPLYEIETLSLHEAVPGHHLQIALQQELTGLPIFRRFAGFTVFSEGWALYAEQLGREVGFYDTPYSEFGHLSYEMWRACRLVVDTGMHYLDWSRRQAIDFMLENTSLSEHNVVTEIDRYIAWPGQALAYKIGQIKILELRRLAERELGNAFDIREFHDAVLLSGAVPLNVLEQSVMRYIAESRSAEMTPCGGVPAATGP